MKTVLILMDSLNRRYLPAYGNDWVKTPNIDRLAADGIVFNNNYCGSMPCIPARRDIFTGRYCFLEAPWGPLEPWDDILPSILRERCGVYSHMITDHPHYFNGGAGDLYHNSYDSWEYMRGQPYDPWHGIVDVPEVPEEARIYCYPKYRHQYMANLQYRDLENEEDYSSLQCINAACDFIEKNHTSDNWFLHLELFDPHEPFESPDRFRKLYDDSWDHPPFTCPEYEPLKEGRDDENAIIHIRKSYAATLTMIDAYVGNLFDMFDRYQMWDDTTVILTTDHGFMLGEHDYWAKNYMLPYQELVHTPLIVRYPESHQKQSDALTSLVDLMPTILDLFDAGQHPDNMHGKSIVPLLRGGTNHHHEAVLYGTFGKEVNLTDGRFTYHRVPEEGSIVHHHACHPCRIDPELLRDAEYGVFLPSSKRIPHFRIAKESKRSIDIQSDHLLFDLANDPGQVRNLADSGNQRSDSHGDTVLSRSSHQENTSGLSERSVPKDTIGPESKKNDGKALHQNSHLELQYAELMREALKKAGAPECQLKRLGLL